MDNEKEVQHILSFSRAVLLHFAVFTVLNFADENFLDEAFLIAQITFRSI
jgi:hypothetical protein